MKNVFFLVIAIFLNSIFVFAQKDTTRLKIGDKKIIIIDSEKSTEIEEGKTELDKGRTDFEQKIKKLAVQLDSLQSTLKDVEMSDEDLSELEAKIKEYEKKIEAYAMGIKDIDSDLEEMESEINDEEHEREHIHIERDSEDKHKKKKSKKKFDSRWVGIDIGLNNFLSTDNEVGFPTEYQNMDLNTSKSWGVGLNFLEFEIPVHPSYIAFVTGMGVEWSNYNFSNDITLLKDENGAIYAGNEDINPEFYKNTLNTIYLNIPLLLEIHLPVKSKYINISGGVVGGIKIASKTKQYYKSEGEKKKTKNRGDYQISPFRYGLTARIGYKDVQLFANYSLVTLFEKDKGPEVYPFTLGISLNLFD